MRPCAILIGGIVCLMVSSTGPASADRRRRAAEVARLRAENTTWREDALTHLAAGKRVRTLAAPGAGADRGSRYTLMKILFR